MKIFLTGNHNRYFKNTVELREKAIKELGHDMVFYNDRSFLFPGRARQHSVNLRKWDLRRMNKRLASLVKKIRPDFCLVIGGHRILRETVLAIKEQEIKIFLWTTDVPADFSNILKSSVFYDYIFCAGTEAVEILEENNINRLELLPFACDPKIHHPVSLSDNDKKKYTRDIVFVGSYYPNRQKVLEGIADYDLSVWGPGWGNLPESSPLKHKVIDKRVNYDEWLKIYSGAKIVLAVHYQDNVVPSKQISPKVFEAMACGRMVLSDRQEDVLRVFSEANNIVCFNDENDLRTKLDVYLKDEKERNRIAESGYKEVLEKHKYTDRLKKIISRFNDIK